MVTFLIQVGEAKHILGAPRILPLQIEGSVAIELINYANWLNGETIYNYILAENFGVTTGGKPFPNSTQPFIPIGSVEFVLDCLKQMGIQTVKPLNMQEELWSHVRREVKIAKPGVIENDGKWNLKSTQQIKSQYNDRYDGDRGCKSIIKQSIDVFGDEDVFMTRWVDDVISEWRVFVYNKEIVGICNYCGDEWIVPDRAYVENIVREYDKRSYAFDVMVYKEFSHYTTNGYSHHDTITDIVELHDFFSCGLYGMSDPKLLLMWTTAIQEIIEAQNET